MIYYINTVADLLGGGFRNNIGSYIAQTADISIFVYQKVLIITMFGKRYYNTKKAYVLALIPKTIT